MIDNIFLDENWKIRGKSDEEIIEEWEEEWSDERNKTVEELEQEACSLEMSEEEMLMIKEYVGSLSLQDFDRFKDGIEGIKEKLEEYNRIISSGATNSILKSNPTKANTSRLKKLLGGLKGILGAEGKFGRMPVDKQIDYILDSLEGFSKEIGEYQAELAEMRETHDVHRRRVRNHANSKAMRVRLAYMGLEDLQGQQEELDEMLKGELGAAERAGLKDQRVQIIEQGLEAVMSVEMAAIDRSTAMQIKNRLWDYTLVLGTRDRECSMLQKVIGMSRIPLLSLQSYVSFNSIYRHFKP